MGNCRVLTLCSALIEANGKIPVSNQEEYGMEKEQEALLLKELMEKYQAGDRRAAERLVEMLNPSLARYLYATSLGPLNLDDLLQECWLRIHKARSSYQPGEAPMPWILAIARHARIDFYRRWQRSSGRETELQDFSDESGRNPKLAGKQAMAGDEMLQMLRNLPDSQREVLVMMKVNGMSIREAAAATNSTPAAVKQKAYRAYQTIRKNMGLLSPKSKGSENESGDRSRKRNG